MDNNDNTITVIDENGNEQLCEILFTFDSEDYNKSYIFYYPAGAAEREDEEVEIFAAIYEPRENDIEQGDLKPIESDEEWEMVEEVLATFIDSELDEE